MPERRNQGILSVKDRDILDSGPEEYPHYFRGRTREKFKQGLADLAFGAENLEEKDISAIFHVLSSSALEEETSYTKEPYSRKTIVNALALFFQAVDLVSNQEETNLESLIRDAIFEAYRRNHPQQVIGSVNVEVESSSRQQSYDRAYRKRREGEPLNSSEMRALLNAEQPIDQKSNGSQEIREQSQRAYPSESEVDKYILDNIEEIEPSLDLEDFRPEMSSQHPDSYALCLDQNEDLVLIVWKPRPLRKWDVDIFEKFSERYGGSEKMQGILVTPSGGDPRAQTQLVESGFEFRELQLGQHGVIEGINHPDDP